MIQSISNSSTNLEPSQTLSSQINKRTAKLPRTSGLSGLSASTRELIIKETLNLIKGVAIDLLKAALTSLNQQANQVGGSKIKDDGGKPQVESTTSSDNVDSNDSTESVDSENNSSQISQVETTPPRKNESLSSFLQRELKPNSEGNFHEEQLQYGIAGYLLNEKSPALYSQYKTAFSEYKALAGSKGNFEDGVKIALKDLVTSKHLSLKNAETINGESFRAAQLDKDFKTLFDDKGGPNDKTIAVLGYKDAAEKVGRTYGRIHRGELDAPARSLNAPSNSKSNINKFVAINK